MELWKAMPKWLRIVLIILLTFCVFADIWYFAIKQTSANKTLDYRFIVNELKDVENVDERSIFTINYYSNSDNSGNELFELKINSFIDESSTEVYSAGIQLIGTEKKPINITNQSYMEGWDIGWQNERYVTNINSEYFIYNSSNNTTFNGTVKLNENSSFLITIDEDYYKIRFKQPSDYTNNGSKEPPIKTERRLLTDWKYYQKYDINYLVKGLYDAVKDKTMPFGTDAVIPFKFEEDIFVYSKKDATKDNTYIDIGVDTKEASLVRTKIENYLCIKVNKFERGVKSASDSLFGVVANNYTYGEGIKKGYYNTTLIVELNEYDFEFIRSTWNYYELMLKNDTIEKLNSIKKENVDFELKIVLDKQILTTKKINVVGLKKDSEISNYKINGIYLNDNGNLEVMEW